MLATNVPWPRPSPGELGVSDVSVSWCTTRPPKSIRPAWIPESTIAIVGTATLVFALAQAAGAPATEGHCWSAVNVSATTGLAGDAAEALPAEFVAVTTAFTVAPTSAGVSVYVADAEPGMSVQAPAVSHRCQR